MNLELVRGKVLLVRWHEEGRGERQKKMGNMNATTVTQEDWNDVSVGGGGVGEIKGAHISTRNRKGSEEDQIKEWWCRW